MGNEIARNTANMVLNAEMDIFSKATSLIEPTPVYDDKLKDFTNYDEKYKSRLNAAMNISSGSDFQYVFS